MSIYSVNQAFPDNLRAAQRLSTRQQLIGAGLQLVAAHGFAGATTAAIAKACGKAHGTVFVHFPTRDVLVEELIQEIGAAITQQLALPTASDASVAEVLDAHLSALQAHEVLYARLLSEASSLPPAAQARVFALQSGIAFRLRQAYERERSQGRVRALDPVLLANSWIALTNHYLMHRALFAPGTSVVGAQRDALKTWLLTLIGATAERPA